MSDFMDTGLGDVVALVFVVGKEVGEEEEGDVVREESSPKRHKGATGAVTVRSSVTVHVNLQLVASKSNFLFELFQKQTSEWLADPERTIDVFVEHPEWQSVCVKLITFFYDDVIAPADSHELYLWLMIAYRFRALGAMRKLEALVCGNATSSDVGHAVDKTTFHARHSRAPMSADVADMDQSLAAMRDKVELEHNKHLEALGDGWSGIGWWSLEQLCKLLASDELVVSSENVVWHLATYWLGRTSLPFGDRTDVAVIATVLGCVRYDLLSAEYLANVVSTSAFAGSIPNGGLGVAIRAIGPGVARGTVSTPRNLVSASLVLIARQTIDPQCASEPTVVVGNLGGYVWQVVLTGCDTSCHIHAVADVGVKWDDMHMNYQGYKELPTHRVVVELLSPSGNAWALRTEHGVCKGGGFGESQSHRALVLPRDRPDVAAYVFPDQTVSVRVTIEM